MFKLNSTGITNGYIDKKYGKSSNRVIQGVPQISFPLDWENPPEDTVSYALVFQDYDDIPEEGFSWIHWLVANIPKGKMSLQENESRSNPNLIQGKNSWMTPLGDYGLDDSITNFYGGPAPNQPHEYEICIYALDTFLELKNGFYFNELRKAMEGKILSKAILKGIYNG